MQSLKKKYQNSLLRKATKKDGITRLRNTTELYIRRVFHCLHSSSIGGKISWNTEQVYPSYLNPLVFVIAEIFTFAARRTT